MVGNCEETHVGLRVPVEIVLHTLAQTKVRKNSAPGRRDWKLDSTSHLETKGEHLAFSQEGSLWQDIT